MIAYLACWVAAPCTNGPLLPWARPKAQVRPPKWAALPTMAATYGRKVRARVDGRASTASGKTMTVTGLWLQWGERGGCLKHVGYETNGYNKWDLRYDVIGLWIHVVFDCLILCLGWGATMGGETDQKRDVTSVEGCVLNLKNVKATSRIVTRCAWKHPKSQWLILIFPFTFGIFGVPTPPPPHFWIISSPSFFATKAKRLASFKAKQAETLSIFRKYAEAKSWEKLHRHHFDWWLDGDEGWLGMIGFVHGRLTN